MSTILLCSATVILTLQVVVIKWIKFQGRSVEYFRSLWSSWEAQVQQHGKKSKCLRSSMGRVWRSHPSQGPNIWKAPSIPSHPIVAWGPMLTVWITLGHPDLKQFWARASQAFGSLCVGGGGCSTHYHWSLLTAKEHRCKKQVDGSCSTLWSYGQLDCQVPEFSSHDHGVLQQI